MKDFKYQVVISNRHDKTFILNVEFHTWTIKSKFTYYLEYIVSPEGASALYGLAYLCLIVRSNTNEEKETLISSFRW